MKHFLHILSIFFLFLLSQVVAAVIAFALKVQKLMAEGLSFDMIDFDFLDIDSVFIGRGTLVASALLVAVLWATGLAGRKVLSAPRTLTPLAALLSVVGFLLLAHGVSFVTTPLGLDDFGTTEQFEGMIKDPWGLLAVCVVVPAAEETVFRAGVLRKLRQAGCGKWTAIVLSGLVFGLCHGNPLQAVPAVIMGIALGWLYTKTDSLALCLLAHVANNSLACLEFQFPQLEELLMRWSALLSVLCGLLVAGFGLYLLARSLREVAPELPAPDGKMPETIEEIPSTTE